MIGGRLARLALAGFLCACNPPPQSAVAPSPAPGAAAVALSPQQVSARSEQCRLKSRERFSRESAEGSAKYAHHYNAKLDTCFYLLTVDRRETVSMTLIDINEGEVYGEFAGPAPGAPSPRRLPEACRVAWFYCASGSEWQLLSEFFMEE